MLRTIGLLILGIALGACAQSEPSTSLHGGETNWLKVCDSDDACDEGSCLCGVCTTACEAASECSGSFAGSCVAAASAAASELCEGAADVPSRLCLPSCENDIECGEGGTCRGGVCTAAPVPAPDGGNAQDGVTFDVVLDADNVVFVEVSDRSMIQESLCGNTYLAKKNELGAVVPLQDDRPSGANNPGYYLDDQYVEPSSAYGCDTLGCAALDSDRIRVGLANEYVKVGTLIAPDGAPNAGEVVDQIETRDVVGNLIAHLEYSLPGQCEPREIALEFTTWMAEQTEPTDEELLLECTAPSPCDAASADLTEGTFRNVDWTPVRCILEALAAGTPGLYQHETSSTSTNSSTGVRHTLLIESAGSVLYTRVPYSYRMGQPGGETPEPAQRCTIADASYFADCLAAIEAAPTDPATWPCAYGDGAAGTQSQLDWVTVCAPETPVVCE